MVQGTKDTKNPIKLLLGMVFSILLSILALIVSFIFNLNVLLFLLQISYGPMLFIKLSIIMLIILFAVSKFRFNAFVKYIYLVPYIIIVLPLYLCAMAIQDFIKSHKPIAIMIAYYIVLLIMLSTSLSTTNGWRCIFLVVFVTAIITNSYVLIRMTFPNYSIIILGVVKTFISMFEIRTNDDILKLQTNPTKKDLIVKKINKRLVSLVKFANTVELYLNTSSLSVIYGCIFMGIFTVNMVLFATIYREILIMQKCFIPSFIDLIFLSISAVFGNTDGFVNQTIYLKIVFIAQVLISISYITFLFSIFTSNTSEKITSIKKIIILDIQKTSENIRNTCGNIVEIEKLPNTNVRMQVREIIWFYLVYIVMNWMRKSQGKTEILDVLKE